jgi:HK97 family phage prohead protease
MLKKYGAAFAREGRRFAKSKDTVDDSRYEPRLAIEGLAILFETPILNKHGETIIFEPKAFDRYFESGARPPFWQGHDATKAFGSNTELCILDEGVAFRLPLTNTYDAKIRKMVESGHDGISIGFTAMKTRDDVLFNHPVRVIEEAEIREISILPRGACKKAFARVIDANREPPLHESVNSDMFGIEYDLHEAKIIQEDNKATIGWLKDRLSALETAMPYDTLPVIRMTSDQINRQTTEHYDRLRAARRAVLGV